MKLAEFLIQGQQLRQQDRTLAIAYFEQCLQNTTSKSSESDSSTKVRILLDLAVELIATKQPESLQRAADLVQRADNTFNQGSENDEQQAYLFYVKAILALELGKLSDVVTLLQAAYTAYGNQFEGKALTDDAIGQYYLRINDLQSALMSFERALSIRLDSTANDSAIGKSYAYLGQVYLASGDINQATSLFQNTLDISLTTSDNFLRLQALKGLAKVAITESQWQTAIALLKDAIVLLKEPVDSIELGYLYCDLAEALLGDLQIEESLICIKTNALARFRNFEYQRGMAIAKHIRGRIYTYRLLEGLDVLNEEAIETAQDSLLDASFIFEQLGMMFDYAKALYDLACLYQLCSNSHFQYQYQGKSLRSLELSLSVLDQLGMSNTQLGTQVEAMLNQVMRGSF